MQTTIAWKIGQITSLVILALMLAILLGPTTGITVAQSDPALMFIENVGQFPASAGGEAIRFQVRGERASLTLTNNALWFTFLDEPPVQTPNLDPQSQISNLKSPISNPQHGVNLKLSFPAASPQPGLEPFNQLDTHISFFKGSDPANWHGDVPVWGGVRYVDLYPGVDLEVTSENGQLVQRLVVREDVSAQDTANPLANIRWQVEGADSLNLDNDNRLHLSTAIGDLTLALPQLVSADGAPLDLSTTPQVNGLEIASPFSPAAAPPLDSQAQIADAANLLFSTYLGGSSGEDGQGIAVDGAGSVYVTGQTNSTNFPTTPGVFDPDLSGFADTFIVKLNSDGSTLEYATYLGGSDSELTFDLTVDEIGQAYVTGFTQSTDFPVTPGAFDSTLTGSSDAFAVKLSSTGDSLVYATLLGNSDSNWGNSIAVDGSGSAYVAGRTLGNNFPTTPGAVQPNPGGGAGASDAFVVKLTPDGTGLEYSTYLGGNNNDEGVAIAVDTSGSAYVTGQTESGDFPTTPGAFQTTFRRAFVVKLNPSGGALSYGTFLGGNGFDEVRGIAVDEQGNAYVGGDTTSNNFPTTPGAFQTTYHSGSSVTREGDLFVVKFNPSGSGLVYGTFVGGNDHDVGFDLAIDPQGRAYLSGGTYSVDFPTTPGAFQTTPPGYPDAFVAKLNTTGSALAYGSYLGGSFGDAGYAIAADPLGNAYITGYTNSTNFPTTIDAFDPSYNNGQDAFATKLATGNEPEPIPTPTPALPAQTCAPTPLGTVTLGNRPTGLAVDSTRRRVYVTNFDSNSVSVVDTNSNTVIQTIPGLTSANGIAHDSTHNLIWVSNYTTGQVTPIQANDNATSFSVLPAVTVGAGPWGVAYDPVHDFIYVMNSQGNSVSVVNAASRTLAATLTGSFNFPVHAAANPVTGKVYVTNYNSHSVTVLTGTLVSRVVDLYDSIQPYGIAVDETRNLVYVATVGPHRIVVIGPIRGVPDQFYGWAAFNRGFGNPRRPVPLRMVAINPSLGPAGDGGHVWATTSTSDGSEANQALFIPKGWGGYFHFPFAQSVGEHPTDGLGIDRLTNRVYVASGTTPGVLTVVGDHATLCSDAFAKIASLEDQADEPVPADETDQIGVEIWGNEPETSSPNSDVNGDKVTDILDLAFIAARYGSSDLTADLNGDGRVDILDLVIVANHYHQ